MAQWRDTWFVELTPSRGSGPFLQGTPDGVRGTRHFLINGRPSLVQQAIKDFMGFSFVDSGVGGYRYISRVIPHYWPGMTRDDGSHYVWASGYSLVENYRPRGHEEFVEGSDFDKLPNFTFAKLVISYVSLRYRIREDTDELVRNPFSPAYGLPDEATYAVKFSDGGGRYISLFPKAKYKLIVVPVGLLRWVPADGTSERSSPITEGVSIPDPGETVQLIHHQRPDFNRTTVSRLIGSINDDEFCGYTVGTLLFEGAEPTPITLANGQLGYDVTYNFNHAPRVARDGKLGVEGVAQLGWNAYLRRLNNNTIAHRYLSADGTSTGDRPFRSADFEALLRPDPAE